MKARINTDNANLVKAKKRLIEIANKVVDSGRRVKIEVDTIMDKPTQVNRLMEQTEAVIKGHTIKLGKLSWTSMILLA